MATAHLLFGSPGVGKTTFAKQLEARGAVRFTPDEWMCGLFGEDPPAAIFPEKASALLSLIQPIWTRCLACGADVVLDYGFWKRSERDEARKIVRGVGASSILYAVTCSETEARDRIARRNNAPDRSLYIAPATFEILKARLEPLGSDEDHVVISTAAA
ncbi:MAG: AAA family ATPase [Proteobacteria bacterium]|nr:AAA family ATPase [Pseudomonadota bacterium]